MTRRCPICQGDEFCPFGQNFLKCMLCSTLNKSNSTIKFFLDSYLQHNDTYLFPNWNCIFYRSGIQKLPDEAYIFNPSTIKSIALEKNMRVQFKGLYNIFNIPDYCFPKKVVCRFDPIVLRKKIPITLGMIAEKNSSDRVIEVCKSMRDIISHIVIVIDSENDDRTLRSALVNRTGANVKVLAHPLAGDFAAQRNRVQAAAETRWVLHLDTDEMLTQEAKRRLPYILQQAEAYGRTAVSMARQNIVDGVVSAHFPDTQVRLLRRAIRFTRRVHEYPAVPSRKTLLALNADILHIMDSSRLGKRETLYEGMLAGAGRPSDTERLRQVLPPDVPVVR